MVPDVRFHFSLDISFAGMVTSTMKILGENHVLRVIMRTSICAHKKLHAIVNPVIPDRAVS